MNLLTRLETESGEGIDADIVAFLHDAIAKRYPPTDDYGPKDRWQFWSEDEKHFLGNEAKWPIVPYTSSVDAALTLVGEGALYRLTKNKNGLFTATIQCGEVGPNFIYEEADAHTPQNAICIVALKVMEQ